MNERPVRSGLWMASTLYLSPQGYPSSFFLRASTVFLKDTSSHEFLLNFFYRVHDRRMVAPAEPVPDVGEGTAGHLAHEEHGDLARDGDQLELAVGFQVGDLQPEVVRHDLEDVVGRDVLYRGAIRGKERLRQVEVDLLVHQRGVGADADEVPLELADVAFHHRGKVERHVFREVDVLGLRLAVHDRHAGLDVGRLDVGDEAPFEPGLDPLLQVGDLLRELVAGDHDLLAGGVQVVEGVEELLLGPRLAGDELDVVDQQDVGVAVTLLEIRHPVRPDGGDQLVGEFLRGDVADPQARVAGQHFVPDGVEKVGLAQADAAVDEERVIAVAGAVRDGEAGGVGELVPRADDEPVEGVPAVERRVGPPVADRRILGGLEELRGGDRGRQRLLLPSHHDVDGDLLAELLAGRLLDLVDVVVLDPLLEELVRGGDEQDRPLARDETEGPEPGLENLLGHRSLQLAEDLFPHLGGHGLGSRPGRRFADMRVGKRFNLRAVKSALRGKVANIVVHTCG